MICKMLPVLLTLMLLCPAAMLEEQQPHLQTNVYTMPIMPGELPRSEALVLAFEEIEARFDITFCWEEAEVITDYAPQESGGYKGMWTFSITAPAGERFQVDVCGGRVSNCVSVP